MPPKLSTESATVQDLLVRYADEVGWKIVPQSEAVDLRKGEGGMGNYSRSGTTKNNVYPQETRSGINLSLEYIYYTR